MTLIRFENLRSSYSTNCMIRVNDLNILPYKLFHLNSFFNFLLFILYFNWCRTISVELEAKVIAIAIISKIKSIKQKRKRRTLWMKAWLRRIFQIISNNSVKFLKPFSLALLFLYALASTFHTHLTFNFFTCIHFWY